MVVTSGSHASPPRPAKHESEAERPSGRRWLQRPFRAWALGTPVVVLLCGALFVVSAENSDGTDLRPGRYTDLASLVGAESRAYERLQERVDTLNAELAELTGDVDDRDVNRYRSRIAELKDPAGLVPRSGAGVTVTLTDSDPELADEAAEDADSGLDVNWFLVHQQDIQAVVNAMWKGGAEAVTVQGKRIISTTGIKCIGNSVTLQGRPYSPPYVITGVGDQGELITAIQEDSYLQEYRAQSERPDIAIGWELTLEDEVTAPAYDGLLDLSYAEPIR